MSTSQESQEQVCPQESLEECVPTSPVDLLESLQTQIREALGEDNRWFFAQNCPGVDPTEDNLMAYYIKNGGAAGHRDRLVAKNAELARLARQKQGELQPS